MSGKNSLFSGYWGLLLLIALLGSVFVHPGPVQVISGPLPSPAVAALGPGQCNICRDAGETGACWLNAPATPSARRRPKEDGTIVVASSAAPLV